MSIARRHPVQRQAVRAPAEGGGWPELPGVAAWHDTWQTIHLVSQLPGKLRAALAPPQPEWFHAGLIVGARGFSTEAVASGDRAVEVRLDLFDHELAVLSSDGAARRIPLRPARPMGDLWADYQRALAELGVTVALNDVPQEVPDTTPFSRDDRPRAYDAAAVERWFAALTCARNVFDAWRAPFFGRTGIRFWWGSFDLALTLFSGRHAVPRPGSSYIMRHDLDAELLSVDFWPGNEDSQPGFSAYLYPQPPGCAGLPMAHEAASWVETMGEWVLPYASVQASPDPAATLSAFLDSILGAAGTLGGWDLEAFSYVRPRRGPGATVPA